MCRGGDVHRSQVEGACDGDRVRQVNWGGDINHALGDVHLGSDGDWVAGAATPAHGRRDGRGVGDRRHGGGVVHNVGILSARDVN